MPKPSFVFAVVLLLSLPAGPLTAALASALGSEQHPGPRQLAIDMPAPQPPPRQQLAEQHARAWVASMPLREVLAHGADPNGPTDSGGNAVCAAKSIAMA